MKRLVIIGCGPKAISIAAKAHILRKLGWNVPEIIIIDKCGPAANWDGTNGYTDGITILGTTPLEDVGFPYRSLIDHLVDQEMLNLSYIAYRIDKGDYVEWVDRSLTAPTHSMLADYYKWVVKKINLSPIYGFVTSISKDGDQWLIKYEDSSGTKEISGEGLVITGPGEPFKFPRTGSKSDKERVFNGQNIWHNIQTFQDLSNARVAVIGGGETAAGIVTSLAKIVKNSSQIEIISRHPILFTRNENWMEVMYFSNVMNWSELSDREKTEVIRHSDRGTFSVAAKGLLDSIYNVSVRLGNVKRIDIVNKMPNVVFERDGAKSLKQQEYDYVIEATGFNPFSFIQLFADKYFTQVPHLLRQKIGEDLSVDGLSPKLHLPGLAAMAQGPGFPNLSCLGLLSERILIPYINNVQLDGQSRA